MSGVEPQTVDISDHEAYFLFWSREEFEQFFIERYRGRLVFKDGKPVWGSLLMYFEDVRPFPCLIQYEYIEGDCRPDRIIFTSWGRKDIEKMVSTLGGQVVWGHGGNDA